MTWRRIGLSAWLVLTGLSCSAAAVPADSLIVFLHSEEPQEHAFSYLLPAGWLSTGGVMREDPLAPSLNPAVAAPQLDFTVERDTLGTAMIRWLPNVTYCDLHHTHVSGSEIFPEGSTYQGMLVYSRMSAEGFVANFLFALTHPQAGDIHVLQAQSLPALTRSYSELFRKSSGELAFRHDAAVLTFAYIENGIAFRERWLTVIEDRGAMGDGQWGNKETVFFRAPEAEFDKLVPVFEIVCNSILPDPDWAASQLAVDSIHRDVGLNSRFTRHSLRERIARYRQEVAKARNAALFESVSTVLPYLNPFSGTPETAPAFWHCRWVDPQADVLLCNDTTYAPDHDSRFEALQFRRCLPLPDSLLQSGPIPASLKQN